VVLAIVAMPFNPAIKVASAVLVGAIVFVIMSRIFMVLRKDDGRRLLVLSSSLPTAVGSSFTCLVDFLIPQSSVADALD